MAIHATAGHKVGLNYKEFLQKKIITHPASGIDPGAINPNLFDFQRDIVKWSLRKGRSASCGPILEIACCRRLLALAQKALRPLDLSVGFLELN